MPWRLSQGFFPPLSASWKAPPRFSWPSRLSSAWIAFTPGPPPQPIANRQGTSECRVAFTPGPPPQPIANRQGTSEFQKEPAQTIKKKFATHGFQQMVLQGSARSMQTTKVSGRLASDSFAFQAPDAIKKLHDIRLVALEHHRPEIGMPMSEKATGLCIAQIFHWQVDEKLAHPARQAARITTQACAVAPNVFSIFLHTKVPAQSCLFHAAAPKQYECLFAPYSHNTPSLSWHSAWHHPTTHHRTHAMRCQLGAQFQ